MLNRDFILSATLHAVLLGGILVISPMTFHRKPDFGEVIRISAVAMSDIRPSAAKPVVAPPEEPPAATRVKAPEVAVEKPTAKPAVKVEKPKAKPKDKGKKTETAAKPPVSNVAAQESDHNQSGTADGKVEVEAPPGSLISGAFVDNASFNYPYWFTSSWSKINQNFRVPVVIDGRVYCDVYFQVIKSGRLIESKIAKESGVPQFDAACLEAIERSAPFPPLPSEFLDEIIGITITFTN
jgi:periplasmic protein TonB